MTQKRRKDTLAVVSNGSIIGRRREQQDAVWNGKVRLADGQPAVLICLADGMGGAVGGQRASAIAVETFRSAFVSDEANTTLKVRLSTALDAANAAIAREIAGNPGLKGMGTTLIGAVLRGRSVTWVSVGDSLLLEVGKRGVRRLNADHSYSELLDKAVQRGEMTRLEAQSSSQRHVLRSAVIGERIAMTDLDSREIQPDSWLVVASDGLLTLSMRKIAAICLAAKDGPELVKGLFTAIEEDMPSDQDNTTLAVARMPRASKNRLLSGPGLAIALGSITLCLALGALFYLVVASEPPAPVPSARPQAEASSQSKVDDTGKVIQEDYPVTPISPSKIAPFVDSKAAPPPPGLRAAAKPQLAPPASPPKPASNAPVAGAGANKPATVATPQGPSQPPKPQPTAPRSPEAKDITSFQKPGEGG